MDFTIFYSWQSDLKNKLNRSFIQDSLEKAAKRISKNVGITLEAVIDRDTYGVPGSPSIVESITSKIAKSDIFVCDISIINTASDERATPNPNVLFELGFASAILGWDRIMMIQNTAFGGPEKLPFDLRGRRILQYHLDEAIENHAEEKLKLKQKLINIFHDAFEYYGNIYSRKEKVIWWGTWSIESKTKVRGGELHIKRVSSDAFFFEITLYDGGRTGEISGKAEIVAPNVAYTQIQTSENKICEIIFRRRPERDTWCIEIEEGINCSFFHGQNSTFSGTYLYMSENLFLRRYFDEIDLNEIERLTDRHLSIFLNNFQQIDIKQDDNNNDLTIISAGVKGLYTYMESIVVRDTKGNLWCACLNPEKEVVRYYTNSKNIEAKPNAMQEWLAKFPERKIIINNADSTDDMDF